MICLAQDNASIRVAGIPLSVTSLEAAVRRFLSLSTESLGSYHFVNAYSISSAHESERYLRCLQDSRFNMPDGFPVLLAMRLRRPTGVAPHRVRGPSFFELAVRLGAGSGQRHALVGSDESTLRVLKREIEVHYPGLLLPILFSPPFTEDVAELVESVSNAVGQTSIDVIWVALGTPKQDLVADAVFARTGVRTAAVGAAFAMLSGTVPAAPRALQRLGLEWVFRFVQEPRRLWRRYTVGSAKFVWLWLRHLYRPASRDVQRSL